MAAQLYPSAFADLQDGTFNWLASDIRCILLGPAFVPDFSAVFVDEIPTAPIIATSTPVNNRTFLNGVAQSSPAEFLQLLDNQAITSAVLYQDVGDPAYSPLISFYDGVNFLGTPLVPLGLDQFVYPSAIVGWFQFVEAELTGEINTYPLAGPVALAELIGGDVLTLPSLLLGGRLVVNTQAVCATPDEPDDCSPPRIRSSICE